MSISSTATLNYQLTNFAVGLVPSLRSPDTEFICPTVRVPGTTGRYKIFNDRNAFQTYNTSRAAGGGATRIAFGASDGTFNCDPQALEATVDNTERDQAGTDSPVAQQLLDQGKIAALLNAAVLSHDKKVLDFVVANTTAVANRGNWSSNDIDPIQQINEQLKNLAIATGSIDFVRILIGLNSWYTLREHPKAKSRIVGIQVNEISLEQLRSMLLFPCDVRLSSQVYASNKLGQSTVSKSEVIGDNVIITKASASPTVYDPSGFKCFTTGQNNITGVRTYRPPEDRFDVHAIDWSEDLAQTSTIATVRLAIT
jgi:hypothetical protein